MVTACFIVLLLLIAIAIGFCVAYSCGYDIQGIEVWINILIGSFSFLLGNLIGANVTQ